MAQPTPGSSSQPPPQPPPGASRDEWREWRRQMRRHYGYGPFVFGWGGGWGLFWGVALILVGGYYLLKNLGLLEFLKGDVIWPILVILLGLWVLVGRMVRRY